MDSKKAFLGSGWKFPVGVDKLTGRVSESSHEESIAESIRLILGTQRGERVMRPEFGCGLRSYTFTEMSYTVMSEIEADVKNSLTINEPRITDIEVECSQSEQHDSALIIEINYTVRSTNNPFNMVYPFYLNETM